MKLLVTGGTVFVSKQTAKYFTEKGHEVYVLNRNHHTQVPGVHLIQCDRNELRDQLKQHHFDAVLDITSYNEHDVKMLLDALGVFEQYVFISSSAVYPESNVQPFEEKQSVGPNSFWGVTEQTKLRRNGIFYNVFRKPILFAHRTCTGA